MVCGVFSRFYPHFPFSRPGGVDLIKLVGFDMQRVSKQTAGGGEISSGISPFMFIFPHWNQDGLLLPLHRTLVGLHGESLLHWKWLKK